jgi:hypothetical protein
MYLNIFDVLKGAKAQELIFAAVTFPSPTTKQATMVKTLSGILPGYPCKEG